MRSPPVSSPISPFYAMVSLWSMVLVHAPMHPRRLRILLILKLPLPRPKSLSRKRLLLNSLRSLSSSLQYRKQWMTLDHFLRILGLLDPNLKVAGSLSRLAHRPPTLLAPRLVPNVTLHILRDSLSLLRLLHRAFHHLHLTLDLLAFLNRLHQLPPVRSPLLSLKPLPPISQISWLVYNISNLILLP